MSQAYLKSNNVLLQNQRLDTKDP